MFISGHENGPAGHLADVFQGLTDAFFGLADMAFFVFADMVLRIQVDRVLPLLQ